MRIYIIGNDGITLCREAQPSEDELAIARFQGRHVAQVTIAVIAGRKIIA